MVETAHERILWPILRQKEFACKSVMTSLAELPQLNLEEEDQREAVQDLTFQVKEGRKRSIKVEKQLRSEELAAYSALLSEFGHLFGEVSRICHRQS